MGRATWVLAVSLVACTTPEPSVVPTPAPIVMDATAPLTQAQKRTTTCSIHLTNLDFKVDRVTKLEAHNSSPDKQLAVANHLYVRGKLLGDLAQISKAGKLTATLLKERPHHIDTRLLSLSIHFTLHRFKAARADLALLRSKPPEHPEVVRWQGELDWLAGNVTSAASIIEQAATDSPGFQSLARLAQLQEATGDLDKADETYHSAELGYNLVNPIPLAWLNVQRGLMDMNRGNFDRAATFFEAAYARCPEYPMAAEHLAEIETRLGHFERAATLYTAVVQQTQEPEFQAAFAAVLLEQGQPDQAAEMRAHATAGYKARLLEHPEAMYWHAAGFYLGLGDDKALALTLLHKNAQLRPNGTSLHALAAAELANGKVDAASDTIQRALATPLRSAALYWTASQIAEAAGEREMAKAHAKTALAINPRIAEM